jgi:hypothetical protein
VTTYDNVVCRGSPYVDRDYYRRYYYAPGIHLEYHHGRFGWHDRHGCRHDRDDDDDRY